jgi:hypothetical protein
MKVGYRSLFVFLPFSFLSLFGNEKIDGAIDLNKREFLPVFIRMSDQLVNCAGEYEKQSFARSENSRSQNRKEVIHLLRQKAKNSWDVLSKNIRLLSKAGEIRNIEKFWIVNGFSCLAQASAIRKLAQQPEVSMIYLDRFAKPVRRSSPMSNSQFQAMRNILAEWRRKDSRAPNTVSIPWNVQEIGAQAAWKEENAAGQGVKVAVIDTGIISTPSLIRALIKNPGEELNGLDDDKNGLIDDLFGYDFIANTGHVLDSSSTTSHGSSCVGIIAGRPSSSGLQTAIAPDSRIMLVKGGFNLRSLEYLMSNGSRYCFDEFYDCKPRPWTNTWTFPQCI